MDKRVGRSPKIERLYRQGESAARRRAAELWDEWFMSNQPLDVYAEKVNDAVAVVQDGPAPGAFKAGFAAAAETCIEHTIDHATGLFETAAS